MKRLSKLLFTTLILFSLKQNLALSLNKEPDFGSIFKELDACFELHDVKANKFLIRYNEPRCKERFPACSTFKWPLALMAFDAGVIKDETTPFKWDGRKHPIKNWNQDQTATTWIANSVVWVSQEITPKLGLPNLKKYLSDFEYGSQDMSGGLTSAWLTTTPFNQLAKAKPTLQISADEQIQFLKRFWQGKLVVSARAVDLTKKVTFIETSPNGYALHGKTGSGFVGPGKDLRLGWFIAHIEKGKDEYVAVVSFNEKQQRKNYEGFAGFEAREKMKDILNQLGVW